MIWAYSWYALYNYPVHALFVWLPTIALVVCIYKRFWAVRLKNKLRAAYYRQLIWANSVMAFGGVTYMYHSLAQDSQKDQPQLLMGIIAILLYGSAADARKKAGKEINFPE